MLTHVPLPQRQELTSRGMFLAHPRLPWPLRAMNGLLVDAALRVIMAYTLSVDTVPALDGALYFVTYIVLQVITHIILHKTGVFQLLFPGRGRRPARSRASAGTKDDGTA